METNIEKNFLPIGTVVKIEGVPNYKFMIISLLVENEKGEIRDYMSVKYPTGVIVQDDYFFFNNEQIEEIIFKGLEDEEYFVYNEILNAVFKRNRENI